MGPCRARFPRYYYNKFTKRCEFFYYGGCRGNKNNFKSLKACNRKCYCKYQSKILVATWICWNRHSVSTGISFLFPPLACLALCARAPKPAWAPLIMPLVQANINFAQYPLVFWLFFLVAICYLPKVVGPCRARFPRYYYNKFTKRCEFFYYGGCRGNKNNFKSLKACNRKCYCKYQSKILVATWICWNRHSVSTGISILFPPLACLALCARAPKPAWAPLIMPLVQANINFAQYPLVFWLFFCRTEWYYK